METAVSTIKLLPENRQEITSFAGQVINAILSGDVNPIELDHRLKCIEETIKSIRKNKEVQDVIISEISKSGSLEYKGARISLKNTVRYDYSDCPAWVKLNNELKQLELTMKTINEPMADTETGEIISPAIRKSTESIEYKL